MTSKLERRYRALLKVLPRWYRADREEEMVGIFLAGRTDEPHSWPGWKEAGAMLGLAARARLGAHGGPARAAALGRVVRTLAMMGLLAGVATLGGAVLMTSQVVLDNDPASTRSWLGLAFELVPLAAFVLLLHGNRNAAKVVAGVSLVPGLVTLVDQPNWPTVVFFAPWWIAFALLCLGFHRDAATPAAKPWVAAAGVAFVAGAVSVLAVGALETYLMTIGLVVVSAVVLATRALVPGFRRP